MTSKISYAGYCPICEMEVLFSSDSAWYRESLVCESCVNGSLPRERALAMVLQEVSPAWRTLRIHECSPIWRGISLKMAQQATQYVCTQFFPDEPPGAHVLGFRNEDIQNQTFEDGSFDLVVSLDVMEHVLRPELAILEIWRTLRPGGKFISTWPISNNTVTPVVSRVSESADGQIEHIRPPIYHRNILGDQRSLVTVDFGYDIHKKIAEWAPFDVRIYRFCDRQHGILGEFTEVVVCSKRVTSGDYARIRRGEEKLRAQ